jgi:hypothetical protein
MNLRMFSFKTVLFVLFLYFIIKLIFHIYKQKIKKDLVIKYNFLKTKDFQVLKSLLSKHTPAPDPRTKERTSVCITDKEINDLVYKYFKNAENPPSFPIEYRKYSKGSKGMQMHKDMILFNNHNYYEAVLTIENTSDSLFKYENKEISVPPNTLVLVKPNTVIHGVSPITKGYRTILKFVVCDHCNGLENNNFFNESKSCPRVKNKTI